MENAEGIEPTSQRFADVGQDLLVTFKFTFSRTGSWPRTVGFGRKNASSQGWNRTNIDLSVLG